jgi:hypothetical protein
MAARPATKSHFIYNTLIFIDYLASRAPHPGESSNFAT